MSTSKAHVHIHVIILTAKHVKLSLTKTGPGLLVLIDSSHQRATTLHLIGYG